MSRARANRRKEMKRRRIRKKGDGWPWPSQESIDRVAPMISISYDRVDADEIAIGAAIMIEEMSKAVCDRLSCCEADGIPRLSDVNEWADKMLDGAVLCTFGRGRHADAATVSWWYRRACLALNLGALGSGVQLVENAPRPEDEFPVVLDRIVKRSEAAGFRRCRVSGGVVEFLT